MPIIYIFFHSIKSLKSLNSCFYFGQLKSSTHFSPESTFFGKFLQLIRYNYLFSSLNSKLCVIFNVEFILIITLNAFRAIESRLFAIWVYMKTKTKISHKKWLTLEDYKQVLFSSEKKKINNICLNAELVDGNSRIKTCSTNHLRGFLWLHNKASLGFFFS